MAIATSAREFIEAAPEDVGMSSARLGNLTSLLRGYVDDGKLAGAISMVARRDRLVHFETYGMMDAEAGKAMRPDAIFRLASMTKPIASVALMALYEEGRLQLDTPVSEFIPAFKDVKVFAGGTADSYDVRTPARPITVRHVLTHTAGFEALTPSTPVASLYARDGIAPLPATGTLATRASALARLPLAFDPGTRFTYHYASDVAGHLCELLSGQPFDAFLEERVLGPLGMTDTSFHVPPAKRDRFTANYEQVNDGMPRYRPADPARDAIYEDSATYSSAGGGLTSTATDYLRFCRMLARGGELDGERILGPRTLQFMTQNHLPGGADLEALITHPISPTWIASGTGFGLGFAVLLDAARAQVLGTPGEFYWGGAFSTAFFVSPAEDLIMIFLTQLGGSNYVIRRQLRATIYQAITD
jgi:CubicO group peptidase (beta-lactamase class C family)